jgi:hypothetical protein
LARKYFNQECGLSTLGGGCIKFYLQNQECILLLHKTST